MERKNKEALDKLKVKLKSKGLEISETASSGAKILILGIQGTSIKIEIRITLTDDIIVDRIEGSIPINELIEILQFLAKEIRALGLI